MAVSKEQQEIINKMKKAQQKRNEVMQKTGRTARGVDNVEEQPKSSDKQPAKKQPKSVDVGGKQGDHHLRWDCDVMCNDMFIVFIVF